MSSPIIVTGFYDEPIPARYYLISAPNARTLRQAILHCLERKTFLEPQPPLSSSEKVLHKITSPASLDNIIDRQIVLQDDGKDRKFVRIDRSDLLAEKNCLELVRANTSSTSIISRVYSYEKSTEFEHLVMDTIPGITLGEALPTLSLHENEAIAEEIITFLTKIRRNLQSPSIKAALLDRKPVSPKVVNTADFNRERFRQYLPNNHISTYIQSRLKTLPPQQQEQQNVFSHCDLDPSNILIQPSSKHLTGIID